MVCLGSVTSAKLRRFIVAVAAVAASMGFVSTGVQAKGTECGGPGQRACPLQHWMRVNVAVPVAKNDLPALAEALEKIRELNPRPKKWGNWDKIARDGAKAAREGKRRRAKSACGRCHGVYRRQYNAQFRHRAIPEDP